MTVTSRAVLPLALVISWLAAATVQAEDTVITRDGKRVRGSIVSESRTEVVLRERGGTTHRFPVDQVERVQYDGPAGVALTQAFFAERAGRFEQALKRYEEVLQQTSSGSPPHLAARFGRVRILAKQALLDPTKAPEAIRALEQFVSRHSASRHYYPALELLARLQLAVGDQAAARNTLQQLEQSPLAGFRVLALVESARLQAARGEAAQAEQSLRNLLEEKLPDVAQWQVRLALAEVLAAAGKFDEAEREARAVIDAVPADDAAMNTQAFLTLGRVYERAKKPIDAILAYLYIDLNYPNAGQARAEALARLAQLWHEVGRPDRARQAREQLVQDYPNSRWARQLAEGQEQQ